ncbi:ORF 73 ECLF1 [hydrothermal vent metagenome]|uniref:ORF 73 ECLF1 n=1 Tax=hydrothermal vent metagenome TaxID=652676 RepID=A0A1W1EBZ6_9ZZZZ
MELTPIKIPEIPLPFDIAPLMHPPVVHFIIALPLIVLLLEIVNLIAKKRAIGIVSFLLLILTSVAAFAAYQTGITDGKEAWDLLSQAGQADLKDHKTLGIYLMLFSAVVLVFKLLSSVIKKGLMKAIYLVVLIFFVIGILKQGKDGGDLVYIHGANVEVVKTMDSDMFDLKEELEELQESSKSAADKVVEATKAKAEEISKDVAKTVETVKAKVSESSDAVKEQAAAVSESIDTKVQEIKESVKAEMNATEAVAPETPSEASENSTTPEVETVSSPPADQEEIATH